MPRRKLEEVAEGIFMKPVPITAGEEVKLKYKGPLAQSGARALYLRAGYGSGDWEGVQDIPMRKARDGSWAASLVVDNSTRLNFCFHDGADNWDNNYGFNWSYEIHDGSLDGH